MRLLELYTSVQGEGPNVGKPTTFVRFAGCNMRCPGWPCDTPYSIYPEIWTKEMESVEPPELKQRIAAEYPMHVCITGGEPLLQQKEQMRELLQDLTTGWYTVDVFTNGSINFDSVGLTSLSRLTVIMDWKLDGSGEGGSFLEQREANRLALRSSDAVKFVVKDEDDLRQMAYLLDHWDRVIHQVYVAPAWNVIHPKQVVDFITKHRLEYVKLNLQIHKYIWRPTQRRI